MNAPKIPLGQDHCVQTNGNVSLLWYKAISANLYKLQHDGERWHKSIGSLTQVSIQAAKNRLGLYQLQTFRRQIYKAIMKGKLLYNNSGPSDLIKTQGAFSLRVQVFAQSKNFPTSSLLELPLEFKFYRRD